MCSTSSRLVWRLEGGGGGDGLRGSWDSGLMGGGSREDEMGWEVKVGRMRCDWEVKVDRMRWDGRWK